MKHKIYLMMASVLIFLMSSACFASDYEDHWAKLEIERAFQNKLVELSGDCFYPDQVATMIEIETVLNRIDFDYSNEKNLSKSLEPFTKDKTDSCMTREELAIIVSKILNLDVAIDDMTDFTDDEEITSWMKCHIAKLQEKKILIGYPDKSFQPKNNITRAELVTIANRCQNYLGQEDTLIENSDVSKIEIGFFEYKNEELVASRIDNEMHLTVGDEVRLSISVPEELVGEPVSFEVQDENIVQIDEDTLELVAIEKGRTQIKFFVNNTNYETTLNMIVE